MDWRKVIEGEDPANKHVYEKATQFLLDNLGMESLPDALATALRHYINEQCKVVSITGVYKNNFNVDLVTEIEAAMKANNKPLKAIESVSILTTLERQVYRWVWEKNDVYEKAKQLLSDNLGMKNLPDALDNALVDYIKGEFEAKKLGGPNRNHSIVELILEIENAFRVKNFLEERGKPLPKNAQILSIVGTLIGHIKEWMPEKPARGL